MNSAAIIAAVSQKYTVVDLGNTSGLVSAELKADVAPGQADLIVVIDASAASHISGVFDQTIEAGLHSTSGVDSYGIGTQEDDIHLDALLNVYDGTTFSRLATGVGPLYIDATGSVTPDRASGLNWRGQPLESFSAAKREQLKAAEQNAIRYFENTALKDVNLSGD